MSKPVNSARERECRRIRKRALEEKSPFTWVIEELACMRLAGPQPPPPLGLPEDEEEAPVILMPPPSAGDPL